jgi:hypothetical protein
MPRIVVLNVTNKPFVQSVVKLSVLMLSVVAPILDLEQNLQVIKFYSIIGKDHESEVRKRASNCQRYKKFTAVIYEIS